MLTKFLCLDGKKWQRAGINSVKFHDFHFCFENENESNKNGSTPWKFESAVESQFNGVTLELFS